MKGSNHAPKGARAAAGPVESRKSKDALWVVFDHRLVLPEYIVEFDLLPTNMEAPQTAMGSNNSTAPMLSHPPPDLLPVQHHSEQLIPGVGEQAAVENHMNNTGLSGRPDGPLSGLASRNGQVNHSSWGENTACVAAEDVVLSCDTAASVAAVRRQAPEVARHCRELGGFLLASEHVSGDIVNPALVSLPSRIREMADIALEMHPLVRTLSPVRNLRISPSCCTWHC